MCILVIFEFMFDKRQQFVGKICIYHSALAVSALSRTSK